MPRTSQNSFNSSHMASRRSLRRVLSAFSFHDSQIFLFLQFINELNVNELLCEEREKEKGGQIRRNKREIYIYINVYKERWNGEESEMFSSKTNLSFFLSNDGE